MSVDPGQVINFSNNMVVEQSPSNIPPVVIKTSSNLTVNKYWELENRPIKTSNQNVNKYWELENRPIETTNKI